MRRLLLFSASLALVGLVWMLPAMFAQPAQCNQRQLLAAAEFFSGYVFLSEERPNQGVGPPGEKPVARMRRMANTIEAKDQQIVLHRRTVEDCRAALPGGP